MYTKKIKYHTHEIFGSQKGNHYVNAAVRYNVGKAVGSPLPKCFDLHRSHQS